MKISWSEMDESIQVSVRAIKWGREEKASPLRESNFGRRLQQLYKGWRGFLRTHFDVDDGIEGGGEVR